MSTLIQIINAAGLGANTLLALDAADANSWPGSGTKWVDTSGGGYDFFLGTTGSGADAPTFSGTVGGQTYTDDWVFNGSQFFTYSTSNAAWMTALHQNNALFSLGCLFYSAAGTQGIAGTTSSTTSAGIQFNYVGATGRLQINVGRAGATAMSALSDANSAPMAGNYIFAGVSIDEAAGTGFLYVNGSYAQVSSSNTFNATYLSPSTGNANNTMQIAARGGGNTPLANGAKENVFMAFNSALSKANFDTLYTALIARGVISLGNVYPNSFHRPLSIIAY